MNKMDYLQTFNFYERIKELSLLRFLFGVFRRKYRTAEIIETLGFW